MPTPIKQKQYQKAWERLDYKKRPWRYTLKRIKQRCNNPNNEDYPRYGQRGIRCLLTQQELKKLWFRDKAYEMDKPSIDRKNNDGNYEFSNCRFIENTLNAKKDKYIRIGQFNLQGKLLKIWSSQQEIIIKLNLLQSCISACINGHQKTSGGFIWRKI